MVKLDLNIEKMERIPFLPEPERDGKGWSYSSVYFLRELRDIFLLLSQNNNINTIADLYHVCLQMDVKPENKKEWNQRNLLELVNALKNFNLLDRETSKPLNANVFNTTINEPLSNNDIEVFKYIYNNYFRFTEFRHLFRPLFNNTKKIPTILYAYMDNSRFFNRFIRPDINSIYYIEDDRKEIMRFWDVYTKWGTTLGELNKCPLKGMDIMVEDKKLSNAYALNICVDIPRDFSVLQYIENEIEEQYIYIPSLEWKIMTQYGFSIDEIKKKLIEECEQRSTEYRLQRTSAIFVDNNEKNLFPKYNNVYMSHILKL